MQIYNQMTLNDQPHATHPLRTTLHHTSPTTQPSSTELSSYACFPERDSCPVYSFVTQTLFVGLFCLVGMFGNSISWYVFHKTNVKSSTLFLFQTLAVVDNFLLLTVFPVFCLEPFVTFSGWFQDYLDCGYKFLVHVIFFPWASVSQTATVWLTVLVGLNRYIAVCKPYQTAKLSSIHQSKIQLGIVMVFSLLYNIPKFFETYPVARDGLLTADVNFSCLTSANGSCAGNDSFINSSLIDVGKMCWCLAFSSYYMNDKYIHGYESVMYTIFLLILPLSILAVLNILLIRQLKKLKKRRAEMQSTRQQHDNNVTLVLIIVVLVFLVCQSPALINRVMWSLYEDTKRTCPGLQYYFSRLSNLLVVANSSVNFFIYYFFNVRFRQVLAQTFCALPLQKCVKKSEYSSVVQQGFNFSAAPPPSNRMNQNRENNPTTAEGVDNSLSSSVTLTHGMTQVTRKKPQALVETKFVSNFQEVTQYEEGDDDHGGDRVKKVGDANIKS